MEDKLRVPKVSVVMPVYNAVPYLGAAIESILSQTFTDFEFLIFNDGSTDGSGQIIAGYAKRDSRIHFINATENKGYVTHLNDGIKRARGTYVARMDADDISLPTRFAKQVEFLDRNPNVAVLGTSVHNMDEGGNISKGWILRATPEETLVHFLFTNYLLHPTVMMRASMVPQEGYREEFMPAEDFDLWTRMLEEHDACSLSEPLLCYRRHQTNTSSQKWDALLDNARQIMRRQIETAGVKVTDEESHLYHRLSMFDTRDIDLETIEALFKRLWRANQTSLAYPKAILLSTMLGRWHLLCESKTEVPFLKRQKAFWLLFVLAIRDLSADETLAFLRLSARRAIHYAIRP